MKKIITFIIIILGISQINAQVIDCVVGPSGVAPQQMTIDFTPPAAPCGAFVSYEIWGSETETGTYSLAGTILVAGTTSFIHNIPSGGGSIWYYYVVFNYSCGITPPEISNTATNEFTNANIQILNVDVQTDPNGILITWQQSPYSQTVGYEIGILQANGTVISLGTTSGIANTTFFDVFSLPSVDINYTISIVDGCGNPSSFNPLAYSQVLFTGVEQDRCDQLITLEWEPFVYPYGSAPSLTYNILVANNGDTTVAGNQGLTATDFNFLDFNDGDSLSFRIEVIDASNQVRSTSEWRPVFANIVQPPTEFFIEFLTVNAQNQIDIYYYIDTLAEIKNFKIKNSAQDVSRPNNVIRKDDYDFGTRNNPHKFPFKADTITDPNSGSYYYQIVANDSCSEDHFSTIGRTIFLKGTLDDFFLNRIEWNDFELENANVSTYRLYRDFGAGMQLLETFSTGENLYMDNVEDYHNQSGTFCYRIEADYSIPIPNETDASYTTSSNTFCLEQRPSVYIPNAIMPNGINNEFRPVIVFGNPTNYSMRIYNRWGEMIFETNSPEVSWLGTKNGDYVVSGGYAYNISFSASDGTTVEKKGIVSVVY